MDTRRRLSAISHILETAEGLLGGVGLGSDEEPWLAVGIGLHCGVASVGNVGTGDVKEDLTGPQQDR